jgi:hypothetical protein
VSSLQEKVAALEKKESVHWGRIFRVSALLHLTEALSGEETRKEQLL